MPDFLHWEAITPTCHAALDVLRRQTFLRKFYLAGGTALALQLGHRISKDLDWFSPTTQLKKAERDKIRHALDRTGKFAVTGSRTPCCSHD
jgi:predicted nucleotidyltransferase component of viral defense system